MKKLLYHYCSLETFENIIKNHTLRFGDITKSNDSEELLFITEFYKQSIASNSGMNIERYFLKEVLKSCTYYAFCLSGKADDLSQWRGYAPDGGVAIGFNATELEKLAHSITIKVDKYKTKEIGGKMENQLAQSVCNEDSSSLEKGHGDMYKIEYLALPDKDNTSKKSCSLQNKMKKIQEGFNRELGNGIPASLPVEELVKECFKYKDIGFKSESETRLIFSRGITSIAEEDVEDIVCVHGERIKKGDTYYDIPFDFSMIKRIIIGPKVDFLGQKKCLPQMIMEFLRENDTFCGEDHSRNLSITQDDIVLTELSYR